MAGIATGEVCIGLSSVTKAFVILLSDGTSRVPARLHEALHAFAWFLAKGTDATTADVIKELASAAHFWEKSKASLGRLMLRIGASLTKDFEHLKRTRVQKTTEAAMRQLRNARR